MAELQEYKCPHCGGALAFDSAIQKMRCPFCDSQFDMEELAAVDRVLDETPNEAGSSDAGEAAGASGASTDGTAAAAGNVHDDASADETGGMSWDSAEAGSDWGQEEAAGLRIYTCESCAGQIVGDQTMAATACPYCGNPVVVMSQFKGVLKPDYVIPFAVDRKAAVEALKTHYGGKRLLPKAFRSQNHIEEVKGVYVPFWIYDAEVDATVRYRATRVRTWTSQNYDYTETKYYEVDRSGQMSFEHVPVDGSSKMPDDLMESLEPYDFSGAVDFQTAYLAGYLADKYDIDAERSVERANARIISSAESALESDVDDYTTVETSYSDVRKRSGRTRYALYPVWILNTTWKGDRYTFAMNGQTGKFVGDLPRDNGAYWRWRLGITAVLTAFLYALAYVGWTL